MNNIYPNKGRNKRRINKMKTKEDLLNNAKHIVDRPSTAMMRIILEVLLDIRDLLKEDK